MSEKMLAAVVTGPDRVSLQEVPRPEPGPYDALTRTVAASFCRGTDSHLIRGTLPFGPPCPFILGHEGVGEVVAVGERCRKFRVGDRVLRAGAAYPPGTPGAPQVGWGGFAEYGIVSDAESQQAEEPGGRPTNGSASMQQLVPGDIAPVPATVLITLKETLSSLRRARFAAGQSVLIYGTGPVGLGFAACARALGAGQILAVGRNAGRLDRMHAFGADVGINCGNCCIATAAKVATDGRGVDLAIDAVGERERIGDLLACLAPGGALGLYGVPEVPLSELSQYAFSAAGAPGWWSLTLLNPDEPSAHDEMLALVASGAVRLERFVTHTFPFAQFDRALAALAEPEAIKVVVTF